VLFLTRGYTRCRKEEEESFVMPAKKARQAKRNALLRRARQARGWSQEQVAQTLDTEVQNISRWETGVAKPKPDTIQKLCTLFGKSPQELGFLQEHPTPQPYHPSAPVYDYAIPVHFDDPRDFVGRDRLLREIEQSLRSSQHVTLSALYGLPGVGKTALAVALAHNTNVRECFTGGVLWAGLGKQPNIVGVLSRWGKQLGMNDADMEKLNTPDSWAGAIRAAIAERRMLIVLDDAWRSFLQLPHHNASF
jgi:transcriptional regulator with XRE-family HTH domain